MEGEQQQQRVPQNNNNNDVSATTPSPLPTPPGRVHNENLYIVQFPKNQVYRVPPRENALIVERYRNPQNDKSQSCCCCCSPRSLLTIALILVSVIAVVAITLATLFFIFNPTGPTFSITHFAVKNVSRLPHYEISLRVKNPNQRLGIIYENSEVSMHFEDSVVGRGKFPRLLEQGRHASTQFMVDVRRTNRAFPPKRLQTPVTFELDMNIRLRITAAGLNTWVMKSNVVCEFKVSNLVNNTRILSQECDTNFRQY